MALKDYLFQETLSFCINLALTTFNVAFQHLVG